MLKFTPLKEDVLKIKNYLEMSEIQFCDLSIGVKYMWRNSFKIDYAIYNETLIMRETCTDYQKAFYFPIGKDVLGALKEIENYTSETHVPLKFCCIDNTHASILATKYNNIKIYNLREWSDYIYTKEQFITYSGKKLSGQRNHTNKFRKSYPDYIFKTADEKDIEEIKNFIIQTENNTPINLWSEIEEKNNIISYIENAFKLNQYGGILYVNNKIVGVTFGEILNDTLIVHVEKADKSYEGVYPTLAQEFAKTFLSENVNFINREEDCGDMGLRISKLQYHPIEVKEKNIITVNTLFDKIAPYLIATERLTVTPIYASDKKEYFKIYTDKELNKYWGYDYTEDLKGEKASEDYFYNFQEQLKKKKEEFSFAVRLDGKMIGELVLWNFDYYGGLEIGYRFLKEYQRKGYAFESASALIEQVFNSIKPNYIKTRCYKENIPSFNLINKLGFIKTEEDATYYYFKKQN